MDTVYLIIAAAAAFLTTALLGLIIVPFLHKLKFGQTILDIGPNWHKSKQGTPTMGGIMFIIGIVFSMVITLTLALVLKGDSGLFNQLTSTAPQHRIFTVRMIAGAVMALSFGLIGFIDDYIKVVKKRNLGLTARQKTVLQFLVAAAYLSTAALSGDTVTKIPFVGAVDVSHGIGLIYWPIALLFIYGFVNAVNLTDGIDGLCSSVTMVISVCFMIISGILQNRILSVLCCAAAGGCCGFLCWNLKPAKVFMGDTGSLFLGGLVVALAFGTGYPIILLFAGILYLIEALSVIIQVTYFKKTKKRIFKMTPIHHHFEMSGWSENKIVLVFSSVTLVGCLAAFMLIYFGV